MLTYIYYSHTDYLDIIRISTNRMKDYDNKILLINKNDMDLSELYSNYKQVLFYDDSLPYVGRLFSTVSKIDLDYILIINDTDTIIKKDDVVIEELYKIAVNNNIDRIDLQYQNVNVNPHTHHMNVKLNEKDYILVQQKNIKAYVYNVNPSIWKLSSWLKLLENFKTIGYRQIEIYAQEYCRKNFNIYKIYGKYVNMGWMATMPFFQFLHITHGGTLLPPTNNNIQSPYVIDEWNKIIKKFNLPEKRNWHLHKPIWAYNSIKNPQDNMF
jgi:hypothetical protein